MNNERRADARVILNLTVKWDALSGASSARIEDLSMGGCFVNTSGSVVNVGELVNLAIQLPAGDWLQLRGEVTSIQPAIGFGMSFPFLTDEEERSLRLLISNYLEDAK
jgi:Tfp pilus assembly protein PilZ